MDPRNIEIEHYDYPLPESQIAAFPRPERDGSKLLVCLDEQLMDEQFAGIPDRLPQGSTIVFNNARVVEARLLFRKPTGASIEIFCLEPHIAEGDVSIALARTGTVLWNCLVGNASGWPGGLTLELQVAGGYVLQAEMVRREAEHFLIRFRWQPQGASFAEILHAAGSIPLPPYIKRQVQTEDSERYQTVYAERAGSVAAPTAGLHFTQEIIAELENRQISKQFVTLHVGAGTFKPVKAATMNDHQMHGEYIEVARQLIHSLLERSGKEIIAVGTTSLRTLESIYWLGHKIILHPEINDPELTIEQWYPYRHQNDPPVKDCLKALLDWMDNRALDTLITKTSLLIVPGYHFKIVSILVTNFHQPRSTLLLLVAAFIGENWKQLYKHALENNYRFLSYGDACLLFRQQPVLSKRGSQE